MSALPAHTPLTPCPVPAFHTYEFVGRPYILRSVEVLVPEVLDPAACAAEPPAKRAEPDDACAEPHAEREGKESTACAPSGEQGRGERRGGAKRVRERASVRRVDAYPACKVAGHTGFLTFARRAAPLPPAPGTSAARPAQQ